MGIALVRFAVAPKPERLRGGSRRSPAGVLALPLAVALVAAAPAPASAYRFSGAMHYQSLTTWRASGGETVDQLEDLPHSCGPGSGSGSQRITVTTPPRPIVFGYNGTFRGRPLFVLRDPAGRIVVNATIARAGRFATDSCGPRPSSGCGTRRYAMQVTFGWLANGRLFQRGLPVDPDGPFHVDPGFNPANPPSCPYPEWFFSAGGVLPQPDGEADSLDDLVGDAKGRGGRVISWHKPILSASRVRNTNLRSFALTETLVLRYSFLADTSGRAAFPRDKVPLTGQSTYRITWRLQRVG